MDPTKKLPFKLWNKILNTLLQKSNLEYYAEVKQHQPKGNKPSAFRRNVCNHPILPVGTGKVETSKRKEMETLMRDYFDLTLKLTSYHDCYVENDLYLYVVVRPIEPAH